MARFIRQLEGIKNKVEAALVRIEIEYIRWRYRQQNKKYQRRANDAARWN